MTITASQLRSAASAGIQSPDANTYISASNTEIQFFVEGNAAGGLTWDAGLGLPKWQFDGIVDPSAFAGTVQSIAQRDALVTTSPLTKAGYLVYVDTGSTKQYQVWSGTAWESVGGSVTIDSAPTDGSANAVSSDGVFDALATKVDKSTLTAKGSLISASAASVPAELVTGTNGQLLAVNTATASGLEWVTPAAGAGPASETVSGTVEIATTAETEAGTGTPDDAGVTLVPSIAATEATYVKKSLVDAKGDLLVATADNVVDNLAVGTNGQVLTADSAEASGVKWATPAPGITDWATATAYTAGQYVYDGRKLYRIVNDHTSSALATDLFNGDINEISVSRYAGPYSSSAEYAVGDLVLHGGRLYRSNSNRTTGVYGASPAEGTAADSFTKLPGVVRDWNFDYNYAVGELVYDSGTDLGGEAGIYRNVSAHTAGNAAVQSDWVPAFQSRLFRGQYGAFAYRVGEYVEEGGKLYRCLTAHGTNGLIASFNATNWTEIGKPTERISGARTLVPPGDYDLDSSGGAFVVTLADTVGTWRFYNTNRSLATNSVSIGTAAETYTNAAGVQAVGPFVLNADGKEVAFLHTATGTVYYTSIEETPASPKTFTPNGAWSASTNVPDMSVLTNRVSGDTYYVYYISATGTRDLGAGSSSFEAGGRLEWFSTSAYNYIGPASVVPAATTTVSGRVEIADSAETDAGTGTPDVPGATLVPSIAATEATYVKKSLVDAKGDLLVATADNTIAKLAVGTNGQALVADSAEASGVKWATVIPSSASTTVNGIVEVATTAETEAGTGTPDNAGATLVPSVEATEATYVKKSIVDAKGDILVATADNTIARLAVGTNGQSLVADSTVASGVKWVANTPNAPSCSTAAMAIADRPAGGNIGTAAATVDVNSSFIITQTTASQTVTLPNPTISGSRLVSVASSSASTTNFLLYGLTILPGTGANLLWNGSAWMNLSTNTGSASRTITGTGITATSSFDNLLRTVAITGITAGSEVTAVTATGSAVVSIVDSGRNGTAYVNVTPNGANTVISNTQTVWRRTVSTDSGQNVNGTASANIDATKAVEVVVTNPGGQFLTGVSATNATVTGFSAAGAIMLSPTNAGNIVLTCAFGVKVTASGSQNSASGITTFTAGDLIFRVATSGSRSAQVATVTGTAPLQFITYHAAAGGPTSGIQGFTATTSFQYLNSAYNFTSAGDVQIAHIRNTASGRSYLMTMSIGSAFNNNAFVVTEF
jgi:hypothetical protein